MSGRTARWELHPVTSELVGATVLLAYPGSTRLREYRVIAVSDHQILAKDDITLDFHNFELASTACVWVELADA